MVGTGHRPPGPATLRTIGPAGADFALWGGRGTVLVTDPSAVDLVLRIVMATLEEVDAACSGHRPDSELVRLGRAGGRRVLVSPLLRDAVAAALTAAADTDGLVDPTVGAATLPGGSQPAWSQLGGPDRAGWRRVELDPPVGSLRLPAGARLDLGATGKAWAADLAAARIAAAAPDVGALVSLAGDLAVTGPAPAAGWSIRVADDHRSAPDRSDLPGVTVALGSGGLATSSVTVRRRPVADGSAAHILDPRTWQPVSPPWRTVSVAATSCLQANTASTAALVLGASAPRWLAARGLPARLVGTDGAVRTVGGWPPDPTPDPTEDRTGPVRAPRGALA